MAASQLRIFPYVDEDAATNDGPEATVTVRFGELYPVLQQALQSDYAWLSDFEDDKIEITSDLYDIIRAFAAVRPA